MEKGQFFEYRDWVGLASFLAVVSSFHIYFRGNKKSIESIDDMANHGSGSSPGDHLLPLQQSYRRVVEKKFADGRVNGTGELENVEILLHNISHKDFILSLSQAGPEDCIARPEFNHYNAVCEDIYSKIRSVPLDQLRVIYRNVEHRARMEAANKSAEDSPFQIPVGIHIPQIPEPLFIEHAKLRRRDKLSASEALSEPSAQVLSAFIPLIALLIPKWLAVMDVHTSGRSLLCQKVLVLVSGEGASITDSVDNSTRYAAMIVKLFISRMYPELNVILIHSTTNVFRYDENIVFVKNTLVPQIEYFRNVLAQRIGAKWRYTIFVGKLFFLRTYNLIFIGISFILLCRWRMVPVLE